MCVLLKKFICFKDFDAAKNAVNKAPYYKLNDAEYNHNIQDLSEILAKSQLIEKENLLMAAVYIIENVDNWKNILKNRSIL